MRADPKEAGLPVGKNHGKKIWGGRKPVVKNKKEG